MHLKGVDACCCARARAHTQEALKLHHLFVHRPRERCAHTQEATRSFYSQGKQSILLRVLTTRPPHAMSNSEAHTAPGCVFSSRRQTIQASRTPLAAHSSIFMCCKFCEQRARARAQSAAYKTRKGARETQNRGVGATHTCCSKNSGLRIKTQAERRPQIELGTTLLEGKRL